MSTFTWFLLASVAFGGLSAVVAKILPPYQPTPAATPAAHAHAPAVAEAEAEAEPPVRPVADEKYDSPLDEEPYEAAPPKKVDDSADEEDDDDGPTQLIRPEQFSGLLDD